MDENGGRCRTGAIDPAEGVRGNAGEGGVVKSDGACADGEDGGRGEDDLEAITMLRVVYVIKAGAFVVFQL